MQRRTITVDDCSGAAVQGALDDARSAGGGIVRLPAGRYLIDRPLAMGSATTLAGEGPGRTVLVAAPGSSCHLITARSVGAERLVVRDLTIDGDGGNQVRDVDDPALRWACGGIFLQVRLVQVIDVEAKDLAQSGFHFDRCSRVRVKGLHAVDLGWSAVSSTCSDELVVESTTVRRAGATSVRSAIHVDGGAKISIDADVAEVSGSAFLLESAAGPLHDVVVRGAGSAGLNGIALAGSPRHRLAHVHVTGRFVDNRRSGVLVSNAEHVFVVGAHIAGNGEAGIVLQGHSGARRCLVVDTALADNPTGWVETQGSRDNFLVPAVTSADSLVPSGPAEQPALSPVPETPSTSPVTSSAPGSSPAPPRPSRPAPRLVRAGRTAVRTRGRSIVRRAPPGVRRRLRRLAGGHRSPRPRPAPGERNH